MNYSYNNMYPYGYTQQYYGGYQQPQYQQPQQTSYFPLTYVSGIEGAKAFIVQPNNTFYLLDSENPQTLYIKSADKDGRYTLIRKKIVDDNDTRTTQVQDISRLEAKIDKIYEQLLPKKDEE